MSCDVTNPNNPLPFCDSVTSLHQPCRTLQLRYSILIWLSLMKPVSSQYKVSMGFGDKGFLMALVLHASGIGKTPLVTDYFVWVYCS